MSGILILKKYISSFVILFLFFNVVSYFIYLKFAIVLSVIFLFFSISVVLFFLLNIVYKKTNNWKNRYIFERFFVTGNKYRISLDRNYEVINVGSNPAFYGFFYEYVRGGNLSTGSQGLEMDFEIIKHYHSYLKSGGVVIIPIMPFTAVSQYLKTKPQIWGIDYFLKFAGILDQDSFGNLTLGKKIIRMYKYPVFFRPWLIMSILHDSNQDNSLLISEQTKSFLEINSEALGMVNYWLKEFDADSLNDFLGDKYNKFIVEAQSILDSIIHFCLDRGYRPVLMTVPVTNSLYSALGDNIHKKLVIDFIGGLKYSNIEFFDYMKDKRFMDSKYYNGPIFLNLYGRKFFSEIVLKDLGILS